jgi:SAM-dependent methyltransferase
MPPKFYSESTAILSRGAATEKNLMNQNLDEVIQGTGSPPYDVIFELLEALRENRLIPEISGIGIELGAGLALLSAALVATDKQDLIQGIFALEAVKPFASNGIEKISSEILGSKKLKILPCYGVFEDIPLENGSLDFACQIESLHHAEDLNIAIREVARVLRPEAYLISIDRSWIDSVSTEVLEEMLDHEYSKQWLEAKRFNSDASFSRRDNGEHEYRDRDWKSAFERAGFTLVVEKHLHPEFKLWNAIKRLLGLLALSNFAGIEVMARPGTLRNFLLQKLGFPAREHSGLLRSPHPRPLTLFVFQKD